MFTLSISSGFRARCVAAKVLCRARKELEIRPVTALSMRWYKVQNEQQAIEIQIQGDHLHQRQLLLQYDNKDDGHAIGSTNKVGQAI